MRVLHVIAALRNSSGPTHVAVDLTEQLSRMGCSVALYHLTYEGMDPVTPGGNVAVRGFPRTFSRSWGYSRTMGRALLANVRDFDLVHAHGAWQYPAYAACRACRAHGVPYIVRPAGAFEPWCLKQGPMKKAVYRALVERANLAGAAAVHAVSEQEARNLRRLRPGGGVQVIPNGIGERCFENELAQAAFRRRHGLDDSAPLVLFLGRLHPKKGLDILTASFARVLRRIPAAKLVVAGRPAPGYMERLTGMIWVHGIGASTILAGDLRGEEKLAAYRAADVFVLPSRSENFGVAVAEAMASGTPVVVSRETPWQEVENRNAGRWVDLDVEAFARHICDILEDRALAQQMGENGRALAREQYTWPRIAEKVLELYSLVTRSRRPLIGSLACRARARG